MGTDTRPLYELDGLTGKAAAWLDGIRKDAPEATHVEAERTLDIDRPIREVERRDRTFRRLLAYGDLAATLVALAVTLRLFADDELKPVTLLLLPLILLAGKIQGLYDRDELLIRKSTIDEAPQIFQLATVYTLAVVILDGQLVQGQLGSDQVLVLWITLFGCTMAARILGRRVAVKATGEERCLFIGDAGSYNRLGSKLEQRSDVSLVGRMSFQRAARRGERSASIQELRDLIAWTRAHRVIIDPQALENESMLELVRAVKGIGVRVSLLPRVLDVVGTSIVFDEIEGMTIMGVRRFNLTRSSRMIKRGFDFLGSCCILLLIAPVLAVISVLIKLDSRGPVLFRQERVGRDGKVFHICKFRTMVADAEGLKAALAEQNERSDGLFKIENDPRITRIGAFLRKTSLDELPQLFNVVGGSMSLVGPRPLIADEDTMITGLDRRRLALTPGMTGHWQVLGSSRVPMSEMVKIDYLYVAGWSLWSDVKILLRTVPVMVARKNV